MATSKDIELVIRATDLSSKPIADIDVAVSKLSKSFDEIEPSARRGEATLGEITAIAKKLDQALAGLAANQRLIELFRTISAQSTEAQEKLKLFATRVQDARAALTAAAAPTAALEKSLRDAQKAFERQEGALSKNAKLLAKVSEAATKAGLDINNMAASEARVDAVFRAAGGEVQRTNALIEQYAGIQRQVTAEKVKALAVQTELTKAEREDAAAIADTARREKSAADERARRTRAEIADLKARQEARRRYEADVLQLVLEREAAEAAAAAKAQKLAQELAQFQKVGTDAEKAARGIGAMAAGVDKLALANARAGASVRQIVDPNAELVRTIGGLETVLNEAGVAAGRYASEMAATGKSTVAVRDELAKLGSVQQGAQGIAVLIDRLKNTRTAAAGAAQELRTARADVIGYAKAVQAADAPSEALTASLKQAEQRLAAAQQRYQQFALAVRKIQTDLAGSGVNTRKLADEMARLQGVAARASTAITAFGNAAAATGPKTNGLTAFTKAFSGSGGRTTLSFLQRLRGEVLAFTAANIGLFGAIAGVRNVLDAVQKRQGAQNRLAVAFGSDAVGKEMEYVSKQAERLGLLLPDVADGYSKFSIAAKSAGMSLQATRYVFESFAEVGKVFNISNDDMTGVFKALEQIMSKGSVQAEELRGQLGDRLTGAFYEFAKAMNLTTLDLNKWLKAGKVSSEMILLFAKQYRDKVTPQLKDATQTAQSQINRLGNSITEFELIVANSGFLDAFTEAVNKLSRFLKSDDGKKFAKIVGEAMTLVTKGVIALAENIDKATPILAAFIGVKTINILMSMADWIDKVWGKMKLLGGAIAAAAAYMRGFFQTFFLLFPRMLTMLTGVGAALAVGFASFSIARWLYDNFEIVRKAGTLIVAIFVEVFGTIKDMAVAMWEGIFTPKTFEDVLKEFQDKFKVRQEALMAGFAAEVPQGPKTPPKSTVSGPQVRGRTQSARDNDILQAEFERLRKLRLAEEADADAAAAKKKVDLAKEVADELAAVERQVAKKEADTLEERVALVDTEYTKIFEKIAEMADLGDARAAQAAVLQLNGLIAIRKEQEAEKWNLEQKKKLISDIKDKEQAVSDQVTLRTERIQAENELTRAHLQTELEGRAKIAAINAEMVPEIQQAAQAAIDMIDALKDPEAQKALAHTRAQLVSIKAGTIETSDAIISSQQITEQWATGLTSVVDGFVQAAVAAGNLKDGFKGAWDAFRAFASDFLRQIATMILKQTILKSLQGSGKVNFLTEAISAIVGKVHTGGVIGQTALRQTRANPAWFVNAPRFHTGGLVGLQPNEVPAILQKGEQVLAKNDPRNIVNGGGGSSQNIKVINTIDSHSVVREGLASKAGERIILNIIQANRSALRQALA
jgi:tape measure domain-containing protein